MDSVKWIELERLDSHPDNPRLLIRQDVIDAIAAQIGVNGSFDPAHSLMVRPIENRYQIIWGHQRKLAAIQAGLKEVPCWIREMTDDEAYLQLGFGNAQGEWKPIEIGLHVLGLPEGERGRGKIGGIKEYARQMGKNEGNVFTYRNGAEVLNSIRENGLLINHFLNKALHLATIHKTPKEQWSMLAEWVITENTGKKTPSVTQTDKVVKSIIKKIVQPLRGDDTNIPSRWEPIFFPITLLTEILLGKKKAIPEIAKLIELAEQTEGMIQENAVALEPIHSVEKYHDWLSKGIGEYAWNVAELRKYWQDILGMVEAHLQRIYEMWLACYSLEEMEEVIGLSRPAIEKLIAEIPGAYFEDIVPNSCQIYNLWNFKNADPRYGIDGFPGRIPGQIVENVLYYYTKPFDVIVDPMGGGGTTLDVCKIMRRRYLCYDIDPKRSDIKKHDITNGFPNECQESNLIFLDPPYWKQKKGDYSGDETNLVNMSLSGFYSVMESVLNNAWDILANDGYVAIIIGPTQSSGIIYDHALEFAKILEKRFVFKNRIIVPYTTQQVKGYHVKSAKEGRYMLKLYRDLLIYQKRINDKEA